MNIGSHLLNNYENGIQEKVRFEQPKTEKTMEMKPSLLFDIKEGSVFKGEIVDISGEKVMISLENQQEIVARVEEGVQLNIGDFLLFSVKENNGNQVRIKPLFDFLQSAQSQTIEKALTGASLSFTEKNYSVAKMLMDEGMPVDRDSLVKVLSQSMKFPQTQLSTIIALNKMDLPVTEENINQYERYVNQQHSFTADLEQVEREISNLTHFFPDSMSKEEMVTIFREVLDVFSKYEGESNETEIGKMDTKMINEKQDSVIAQNDSPSDFRVSRENEIAVSNPLQGKTTEIDTFVNEKYNTELFLQNADQVEMKENQMNEFSFSKDIDVFEKQMEVDNEFQQIFSENVSSKKMLGSVFNYLEKADITPEQAKSILQSNEVKGLLENVMKEAWSVSIKQMNKPQEIDTIYRKIEKQTKELEVIIQNHGGDSESFQQNSQNMKQNMNFMEQLNQHLIYAQMPVKMSEQQANMELYVYADKRRLVEKKDGISVMLHLDMDHLGKTDIKVTLNNHNVNARFYVNDQQSVDILSKNILQLEEKLLERGFSLTNEVIRRPLQDSGNKVINEIIDENAEKSVKRYTFDVKM